MIVLDVLPGIWKSVILIPVMVKHVKPIQENIWKFYLQVITDTFAKIAVPEICSEKKTRESVVEAFKKNALQAFVNKFWKKNFQSILGKIDKKRSSRLSRFWPLMGWGWGEGVNPVTRTIRDKNLFQIMLNEILESCKNDTCWYKNWCKTRNKKTDSSILQLFTDVPCKTM